MLSDEFDATIKHSDLDAIWNVLCKIMTLSANEIFRKKWFKNFDSVFTKVSLKFHKLELLISKIVKASCKENVASFVSLMKCWNSMDSIKASVVQNLIDSGVAPSYVHSALSGIKKFYHASKLAESLAARKANIRTAIDKRMESFETNKGHIIRSVLEHPFCKVVLDHLVVDDKLILEPDSVKSKMDVIMEGWTKKHGVVANISYVWSHQYWPLDYVFDEVFSGVIHSVELSKLLDVIFNLPDGKAAGLLSIINKLWKHCDQSILDMLLVLLNFCLSSESVSRPWVEAWVSIIPKLYE
ncbi:hypothetical protein G9A89_013268 [Geosiphon pyriformis]|nr:hypothetical protein G9A89_013268 [Geosiphon pyriformis]